MPTPRTNGPTRVERGYTIRKIAHLLGGIDWTFLPGEGWGILSNLPDDELRAVIEEMQAAWDEVEPQGLVTAEHCGMNPGVGVPPWFTQFAGPEGNRRLFLECHKSRSYMEYQRANNGYRPREDFERQYTPPAE